MPTTSKLALRYPSGAVGVPPDVAGDMSNLAADVDSKLGYVTSAIDSFLTLPSGVALDYGPGLTQMFTLGPLRVASVSLYYGPGAQAGTVLATMNAGHRPANAIFTGALVYDNGVNTTGTAFMNSGGGIGVSSWTPDVGADGKYQALRAVFTYIATQ